MTRIGKLAVGALATIGIAAGTTLATTAPADARVAVGIGIGVPGYYYGPGYYPPGPCSAYNYYYSGYCGYPVYGGAVFVGGRWAYGPHYYRWWGGRPWFWHRGGWHYWGGWRGAHFAWNRGGHWGGRWAGGHATWRGHVGSFHGRSGFGGRHR
jgi:hypothetical protein